MFIIVKTDVAVGPFDIDKEDAFTWAAWECKWPVSEVVSALVNDSLNKIPTKQKASLWRFEAMFLLRSFKAWYHVEEGTYHFPSFAQILFRHW